MSSKRLDDLNCIVTGASRGIGQSIAIEFAKQGAAAIIVLDKLNCDETINTIKNTVRDDIVIKYIPCDISQDEQSIKDSIDMASDCLEGGRIDVLVNNASAFVFGSIETASYDDWTCVLGTNIRGQALITKYSIPHMKEKGGSIVFIGSISSFRAQPNACPYSVTKAALIQMSKSAAYDLAKYNIRVNCVCPGTIETPISLEERRHHNWDFEEWEKLKTKDVIMGRVGNQSEVAKAVLFFASNESSYCTGTELMVDGGQTACTVMQ